jgi:hypothetical protein
MKKIILYALLMASTNLFSQVGIGTASPAAGALLDLTATDKALLLTRVANTSAVPNPVNGMVIYDLSINCIRSYENNVWTGCWSAVVLQPHPIDPNPNSLKDTSHLDLISLLSDKN